MKSFFTVALFSVSALAAAAPRGLHARTICHAGRTTINGQQYTLSCGLDRYGGDCGAPLQGSWDACQAACNADNRCVTAQYHEGSTSSNGWCYFKSDVNPGALAPDHDTIDLGIGCTSGTVTFGSSTCTISCGQDSHGGDYQSFYVGNYLACAQACSADSGCATAQYNEGNGFCYLKNAVNGFVSSSDTDSVVCTQ